jgi:uncharacterized damage-inducible protein DinB
MMTLNQLISRWKQVRAGLLVTIRGFSDEELSYRPIEGGWTVAQLMLHIAHEENGEIHYGITGELTEWPAEYPPADYPSLDSIEALLTKVHDRTEAYLETLDDADLERVITAPWGKSYPLTDMLWHVLEHEIHHRGELSLILGLLGHEGLDA